MIAVAGATSQIAAEFMRIVGAENCRAVRLGAEAQGCDRFLVCSGLLVGTTIGAMLPDRIAATFMVNFADVAAWCDSIFATEPTARVCVVGSESGYSGSYDMAYAGSKAALHMYVEAKRLHPDQQLVCVAPGIIVDAGMTTRRSDFDNIERRKMAHPKRRFVTSREVAAMAAFLLGPDGAYVSGTVVRMHGGERR